MATQTDRNGSNDSLMLQSIQREQPSFYTSSQFLDRVPDLQRLFKLVVKRVSWKWEELATMLALDSDGRKIDSIRRDFWGVGVEICCMQALHHWVRGEGSGPVSWRTLLKYLQDIDCGEIAEDIAKKLKEGICFSSFYSVKKLCMYQLSG